MSIRMKNITLLFRKLYSLFYYCLFLFSFGKNHPFNYISPLSIMRTKRNMYLGKGFIIRSGASIGGSHFKCGNNVRVGHGCHFFGHIEIGNDVMIGISFHITRRVSYSLVIGINSLRPILLTPLSLED